jgi:arsenate reductase
MLEVGIDLTAAKPRKLTPEIASQAQILVAMGCEDASPVVPGARYEDWQIEDPKGKPLEQVRAIRDETRDRVQKLVTAKAWGRADLLADEKYGLK